MREKLLWSTVVLLGLSIVFGHAQTPTRNDFVPSRYQIFIAPGSPNEEAQVFKLDTLTGKTWEKAYSMERGAKVVAWANIPDYPSKYEAFVTIKDWEKAFELLEEMRLDGLKISDPELGSPVPCHYAALPLERQNPQASQEPSGHRLLPVAKQ
jgi:pentatricopeptide repeat protein